MKGMITGSCAAKKSRNAPRKMGAPAAGEFSYAVRDA
jgi:hypothetical protein